MAEYDNTNRGVNGTQLDLFAPAPDLRPDVIVFCPSCGRRIVAQHFRPGYVDSEYRGARGECFECTFPGKKS